MNVISYIINLLCSTTHVFAFWSFLTKTYAEFVLIHDCLLFRHRISINEIKKKDFLWCEFKVSKIISARCGNTGVLFNTSANSSRVREFNDKYKIIT